MPNTTVIKFLAWENDFDPYEFRVWMEQNSTRLTFSLIAIYLITIFSLKKYSTFSSTTINQNHTIIIFIKLMFNLKKNRKLTFLGVLISQKESTEADSDSDSS